MSYQDDETEELLRRPAPPQEKEWDQFPDSPRDVVSDSMVESSLYNNSLKILHLTAFVVTFAIVLGAATISKGTLLFMTSQVSHKDSKPYCNKDLDRNRQFVVTLPATERTVWIWMLFYAYCIPNIGTFLRSVRICLFKKYSKPSLLDFVVVLATETMPSIGSALLVFCILPELDVVKGAMLTNAVCFIPAVISVIMGKKCGKTTSLKFILDVLSTSCQATAFIVWPLVEGRLVLWTIPAAVLLIAAGYWENFVKWNRSNKNRHEFVTSVKHGNFWQKLAMPRIFFENSRYFTYAFVSLWKIAVFYSTMLAIFWIREGSVDFIFKNYGFVQNSIEINEITPIISSNLPDLDEIVATGMGIKMQTNKWTAIYVFLINILSTYVAYIFGKFACKILIQGFSYAFPINLTMPVAISALVAMSGTYARDACYYSTTIPMYLFFDIPPLYYLEDFLVQEYSWIWLLWLLSQAWITRHIWIPSSERLARTERLYMRPMYDPFLIDQDIALNRRKEAFKHEIITHKNAEEDDNISIKTDISHSRSYDEDIEGGPDETIRIYACGTMWHETKDEMMAFLKSILRVDSDQCARKIACIDYNIEKDYYELETHIFFDDAFFRYKNDPEPRLNDYVNTLIGAMDESRKEVHEIEVNWPGPVKISTPYGGRLVWTLPGGSKIYAHLKDKKKIRAKKRWSQVMYMYYLLGHRLMDGPFQLDSKEIRAENTFVLALDGDIDFKPEAVLLLVDLMKKSKTVGAACGRIHPIGSGPMVWYQIFEYAIGHWLQKATEHVIGCVLCSPGCFSLFRGSALMTDNVMKKYTTESQQARHFVQYDQGEDRWLCTLLLQRGFRVEYSAASDAYTHAPEGFNEFYNQRRRWMPSTTANILDLLTDYNYITHTNENISMLYILYQGVMMIGTVLGPGTIFLMLVGAFVAAFQMDQWSSFIWNAVPIVIFMTVCKLFEKADIQLFFAALLSAIYGLVMMAVLVGVLMQIQNDGILSPSSLFFFFIAAEMVITAMMHPKEFGCVGYGVVYYVTVPSMYLLLVIYSVFNMNNISWGTRETVIVPDEPAVNKNAPAAATKKQGRFMNILNDGKSNSGSIVFSIASLFKCFLCTTEASPEEQRLIQLQKSLEELHEKLERKERRPELPNMPLMDEIPLMDNINLSKEDNESLLSSAAEEYEELNWWMDDVDEQYKKCETDTLSEHESIFWKELMEKYLKPDVLEDSSKEKKQIKKDLDDLRDKSVNAFFMINSLFVLVVFLLTLKKDLLHINWPFGTKTNFTYVGDTQEISMTREYLQLEPIGFVFLIFFGILMGVQFLAMFQHRFETMCQILANMEFNVKFFKSPTHDTGKDKDLPKRQAGVWIEAIKDMQRLKPSEDEENAHTVSNGGNGAQRKTIIQNKKVQERLRNGNLTHLDAYKRTDKKDLEDGKTKKHKKTHAGLPIELMQQRKTRVLEQVPRKSVAPDMKGYINEAFIKNFDS